MSLRGILGQKIMLYESKRYKLHDVSREKGITERIIGEIYVGSDRY